MAYKTFTNSNFKGRCKSYNISCDSPIDIELPIRVTELDRKGREWESNSFCCIKCANDFYGELSEGTSYPFPEDSSAPTRDQIAENITYLHNRY